MYFIYNLISIIIATWLFGVQDALSTEIPKNWPWRGVTLDISNSVPEDIIILKKRLDINSVRITLNVRQMAQRQNLSSNVVWSKGIEYADKMLDACRREGVAGIISIHQFPINPNLLLNQESPGFWNNPEYLTEVISLVGNIVKHFEKRGTELGAYEVLSEPLLRDGNKIIVPPAWPKLLQDIIKEVRKYDFKRWIIVTPGPGRLAKGYKEFKPLDDKKIIYGAHMYTPHNYTHQGIKDRKRGLVYPGFVLNKYWDKKTLEKSLSDLRSFQEKYNVFVWIGEFSVIRWAPGGEQYLLDLVSIFNRYGWGWAYHSYKGYHGWNPDYDSVFSIDKPKDWQSHYVGEKSVRWETLKKMFSHQ